jgi:hypothetical protein
MNEADDEEDEYDFDELDAFAENTVTIDEEAKSELDTGGIIVPPVTLLNQAYADDLREFLEAEKLRKEQCGSDIDEEFEERHSIQEDSNDNTDDIVVVEERQLGRYDNIRELKFPSQDDQDSLKHIEARRDCSEPIYITSDDELDFWSSPKQHAQPDSLKRKRDSTVDFSEVTVEEASPKRSGSHSSCTLGGFSFLQRNTFVLNLL